MGVWGEEGWGPEEAKPKLGQNQILQGEIGCAKEEEIPSREQQGSDSQLDTSWNDEEERDGKQGGVTWQEWKQQESDDQTVPVSDSLPWEEQEKQRKEDKEEDKDQLVPSSSDFSAQTVRL